jgi:predicted permease
VLRRVGGYLFGRARRAADLDEELRAHLAIDRQQRIEAGERPEDAHSAALRDLGNVLLIKEVTREMWGWDWLEQLGQDLRYGCRMLRKNPGFAVTAILSMGLGVGAATGVFTVYDAVALKPIDVPEPERLMILRPEFKGTRSILVNPIFEVIRDRQQSMTGIFAGQEKPNLKVRFAGETTQTYLPGVLVSGAYFRVLGLRPAAGRFFAEPDDQIPGTGSDAGCAAVISYPLWERQFQHSSAAIGTRLDIADMRCTIVGVAPEGFRSHQPGYQADLWLPMRQMVSRKDLENHFGAFFSGVAGRLKTGVSASQASAELTLLFRQAIGSQPPPPPGVPNDPPRLHDFNIRVVPGGHGFDAVQREFERPLGLLLLLTATVLLIAAANVAGLILARGAGRRAELATRTAMGASSSRIVRQLLAEGIVIGTAGGVVGVGLAYFAGRVLVSYITLPWMPVALEISLNARFFLAALGASASTILLASLIPAFRLSQVDPHRAIAEAVRTVGAASGRFGRGLVIAQLGMSLALMVSTGLLLRTMAVLASVDLGFRPDNVLVMQLVRERPAKPDTAATRSSVQTAEAQVSVEAALARIPNVVEASLSWLGLFGTSDLSVQTYDPASPDQKHLTRIDYVSTRYFQTAGMAIHRGRTFRPSDRADAVHVAVINQSFAAAQYGGEGAVGRRVGVVGGGIDMVFEIIGVVGDSKYNNLRETQFKPMIWLSLAQIPQPARSVMLRVQPGQESAVARQVQTVVQSVDPSLVVRGSTTLREAVHRTTLRERISLGLASGLAVMALLLAAIGVYGSLSLQVTSRTREIGLRMALGADPTSVMNTVIGGALRLAFWGFVIGLPLAVAAGSALRSMLFGIGAYDGYAIGGACLVLAGTASVAAVVPARRAARIEPVRALQCE